MDQGYATGYFWSVIIVGKLARNPYSTKMLIERAFICRLFILYNILIRILHRIFLLRFRAPTLTLGNTGIQILPYILALLMAVLQCASDCWKLEPIDMWPTALTALQLRSLLILVCMLIIWVIHTGVDPREAWGYSVPPPVDSNKF